MIALLAVLVVVYLTLKAWGWIRVRNFLMSNALESIECWPEEKQA